MLKDIGLVDSPDLPNLLAGALVNSCKRILRKGLDRGYQTRTIHTRSPRGQILMNDMIKQQSFNQGRAICDVDEFTPDIIHNQIIKETLRRLAISPSIETGIKHELRLVHSMFNPISPIRLTTRHFGKVQLSRQTVHYALPINICEFIHQAMLPDESGEGSRFSNILEDKIKMSTIFEKFLLGFCENHLSDFRSTFERFYWDSESIGNSDIKLIPQLETDLSLFGKGSRSGEIIIADAKYYTQALKGRSFEGRKGQDKISTNHLAQLSTYLAHYELRYPNKKTSGMLIYPENKRRIRESFKMLGRKIDIVTVDLSASWQNIHKELIELFE